MEDIEKVDRTLKNLIELAYKETEKAKVKDFFSKDLAEACGVVVSLAYGRWGK